MILKNFSDIVSNLNVAAITPIVFWRRIVGNYSNRNIEEPMSITNPLKRDRERGREGKQIPEQNIV